MLLSVIACVEAGICALGLESKELFLLAEIDEHPYPAELAATLSMPKATVTVYLKRLEAAGFVRREIDPTDLRRHRLLLTPTGRQAATTAWRCCRGSSTSVSGVSPSRSRRNSKTCSKKFCNEIDAAIDQTFAGVQSGGSTRATCLSRSAARPTPSTEFTNASSCSMFNVPS